MSRFLDNDGLFMFLFIFGSAIGVIFLVVLICDLVGTLWQAVFHRNRPAPAPAPPPSLPRPNLATFDQLDAVVGELYERWAR